MCGWDSVLQMISATGWPRQLAAFAEKVLVARGAAKAVAIVSELQMYQRALSCMKSTFDALQLSLASIDSDASIWFVVNRQGHIDTLKDCAAAAEEIGWWLAEMLFGDTSHRKFVAADCGHDCGTVFVPTGFGLFRTLQRFKNVTWPILPRFVIY